VGRIISKIANAYKKHGPAGFFKKLYSYVRANYMDKISLGVLIGGDRYREEISAVLREGGYDRVILLRNSFGFASDMFQRPQHIAVNLAKCGCLVFYEVTSVSDGVKTFKRQSDLLYLFNFNNVRLNRILMDKLKETSCPKYVQVYSTDWKLETAQIENYKRLGFGFVYEYIDHLSPELTGTSELPKSIAEKYDYAVNNKDATVVVTANELWRDIVSKRGEENLAFSGNGVDYSFFREFDPSFTPEKEFRDIIGNGKINVCYYGALAKWFDYDLIKKVAGTGRYNVILFGIKYDASYDEKMGDAENVYYLGLRDYKVLKYYAKECDILTIPFLINSITRATSPLKLYEYMALERPVVTTDMNECRKYGAVFTASDHDEFIRLLDEAYSVRNDEKYLSRLRDAAKENDWSEKAKLIVNKLKEKEDGSQ